MKLCILCFVVVGDQILVGHWRQSVHGAFKDRERKHNSSPGSLAGAAEHNSVTSKNCKTSFFLNKKKKQFFRKNGYTVKSRDSTDVDLGNSLVY